MCYIGLMISEADMTMFLTAVERLGVHQRVVIGPRALTREVTHMCGSLAAVRAMVQMAGPQAHVEVWRTADERWMVKVTGPMH